MRRILSIFGLLLIFSTGYAQSKGRPRGGLSGSGGGSGALCFANAKEALMADPWLEKNQTLPPEILDKGRLQVLETWEMEQTQQPIWTAEAGVSWEAHLEEVKNKLRDRFPLFMFRLDQTADWIKQSSWEDVKTLQLLDDATPMVPLPENCRRVQLVLRFSVGNNPSGQGPVSVAPRIRTVFVKEYFSRLSVTDQAVLMFHEQMYILGQAVGHPSSDIIRAFIRIFFAASASQKSLPQDLIFRSPGEKEIRRYLIRFLGDYVIYFNQSHQLKSGAPYSSQRHFSTYLRMLLRQRNELRQCQSQAESKGLTSESCLKEIMKKYEAGEGVTDEEAFILFVVHYAESNTPFNGDQVLDPSGRNPEVFQMSMTAMCLSLERDGDQDLNWIRKSISYCREWTLSHRPRK